jgi:hypothetical protein
MAAVAMDGGGSSTAGADSISSSNSVAAVHRSIGGGGSSNRVSGVMVAVGSVIVTLKGTMNYGIHYSKNPKVLEGYSDSNWISDANEIKDTSGYAFMLGGGAVSWKSCKQTILTRSTMKVELTVLDTATVETEWLLEHLMDMPMVEKPIPTILMNCDNETVITKVNSSNDNMKSSRHVKRRLKYVRNLRNSGVVTLDYIPMAKNLADQFTKGLS